MATPASYQTQVQQADNTSFIRNVLKANAAFSSLSGIAFIVAATPIATFLGLTAPAILTVTGIILLVFAGDLLFLATRKSINAKFVMAVMVADILWVIGSVVLLLSNLVPFTAAGKWAIGIVAVIVAAFAEMEYFGLKKMKSE